MVQILGYFGGPYPGSGQRIKRLSQVRHASHHQNGYGCRPESIGDGWTRMAQITHDDARWW
jgi:hypothetical protein